MATAFDKSQVKSTIGWSNSFRRNAAFPLDIHQYFGSVADAEAAAATAEAAGSTNTVYHYGMQLYVFDGTDAHTYLIQGDNTLKELASGDEAIVYWEGSAERVNFHALTQTAYDAIESPSDGTLYFTTDTHQVYRGAACYTDKVELTADVPDVADAVPYKIYIDANTFEVKATANNLTWVVASPGYLTDNANWADADSNKLATIGLIKKGIEEAISNIQGGTVNLTFDADAGTVSAGGDEDATLTGVAHTPTYDSTNLVLTIPVYGGDDLIVNIPKDKFVTGGYYDESTEEIVLTIEGQDEPIRIPAAALVKQLEADNTGKDVVLTIADGKISGNILIDPAADNLATTSEAGLLVDGSAKMDKLEGTADDAGKIVIVNEDGSQVAIGTVTLMSLLEKLDTAAAGIEGTSGNIVAFDENGKAADSGVAIGGAQFAETTSDKVVATEAGVEAAITTALSWEAI